MDIAVSPYHLTTREAAAMAALLLGRRVLTMLPAPVEASAQAAKATGKTTGGIGGMSALQTAATIPTYRRFVESWAWTVPLWERGVLQYSRQGETFVNDMWAVTQHIDEDDTCIALRHFTKRHDDYPDDGAYLSAVAADMLKGGPDPGISLPVAAALDRFATRHGLAVARTNTRRNPSRAQQAEATLATPLATFTMPMLMQASASRILHWREVLAKELTQLSQALRRLSEQVGTLQGGGAAHFTSTNLQRDIDAVHACAEAFSNAVATRREELLMGSIDDDVKPIETLATISCVPLPWDAVLKSSVRAIETLGGEAQRQEGTEARSETAIPNTQAISKYDSVRGRSFLGLAVKVVGK